MVNTNPSRIKLARAAEHVAALEAFIDNMEAEDYVEVGYQGLAAGKREVQIVAKQPLPDDISLLIGDSVHNLRCALDYYAVEAVKAGGGSVGSRTQFPFGRDEPNSLTQADSRMAGAAAPIITYVKSLKAYPAGTPLLAGIQELSNLDKHNRLIPHSHSAAMIGLEIDSPTLNFIIPPSNMTLTPHSTLILDAAAALFYDRIARLYVALEGFEFPGRLSLTQTLNGMGEAVTAMLDGSPEA